MSSRSASALLDAALAVPFDPEEEDRRQLALAQQAQWEDSVPPQELDIAPEAAPVVVPQIGPDPLVAEADAAMAGGLDANGEPPLPQADEDLPPVRQSASALLAGLDEQGAESGEHGGGGQRTAPRTASGLLADIEEPETPKQAFEFTGAMGTVAAGGQQIPIGGKITFDPTRLTQGLQGAYRAGLISQEDYVAEMGNAAEIERVAKERAELVKKAREDDKLRSALEEEAGENPELKALLYGVGRGGAAAAGAVAGAKVLGAAGAMAGTAVAGPPGTAVGGLAGGALGAIGGGVRAMQAFDSGYAALGRHLDEYNKVIAASKLKPEWKLGGELGVAALTMAVSVPTAVRGVQAAAAEEGARGVARLAAQAGGMGAATGAASVPIAGAMTGEPYTAGDVAMGAGAGLLLSGFFVGNQRVPDAKVTSILQKQAAGQGLDADEARIFRAIETPLRTATAEMQRVGGIYPEARFNVTRSGVPGFRQFTTADPELSYYVPARLADAAVPIGGTAPAAAARRAPVNVLPRGETTIVPAPPMTPAMITPGEYATTVGVQRGIDMDFNPEATEDLFAEHYRLVRDAINNNQPVSTAALEAHNMRVPYYVPDEATGLSRFDPVEFEAWGRYVSGQAGEARAETKEAGAVELLDAVRDLGGLPGPKSGKSKAVWSGELKALYENSRGGRDLGVKGATALFRNDAPDLDDLVQGLKQRGFRVDTEAELLELLDNRLRSGREIFGYGAFNEEPMPMGARMGRAPRQMDLLGEADVEFQLVGQTDAKSLTPAELAAKAQAEADAAAAEKAQGDLFGAPRRGAAKQPEIISDERKLADGSTVVDVRKANGKVVTRIVATIHGNRVGDRWDDGMADRKIDAKDQSSKDMPDEYKIEEITTIQGKREVTTTIRDMTPDEIAAKRAQLERRNQRLAELGADPEPIPEVPSRALATTQTPASTAPRRGAAAPPPSGPAWVPPGVARPADTTTPRPDWVLQPGETSDGRRLIKGIENYRPGQQWGYRSIVDHVNRAVQVEMKRSTSQTTRSHPGVYRPGNHTVFTRATQSQINFHEAGHGLEFLIEAKQPGFWRGFEDELLALTQRPDSMASEPPGNASDAAKRDYLIGEGVAEWTRLLMVDPPAVQNLRVTAAISEAADRFYPKMAAQLRDAARAVHRFQNKPAADQWGMANAAPDETLTTNKIFQLALTKGNSYADALASGAPFSRMGRRILRSILKEWDNSTNQEVRAVDKMRQVRKLTDRVQFAHNYKLMVGAEVARAIKGKGLRMLDMDGNFQNLLDYSWQDVVRTVPAKHYQAWMQYGWARESLNRYEFFTARAREARAKGDTEAAEANMAKAQYPGLYDGITPAKLKEIVKAGEANIPNAQLAFAKQQKYFDALQDLKLRGGMKTKNDIERMMQREDYMPLPKQIYRSGTAGTSSSGDVRVGDYTIKGSQEAIQDLNQVAIERTKQALDAYANNRLMWIMEDVTAKIAADPKLPVLTRTLAGQHVVRLNVPSELVVSAEQMRAQVQAAVEKHHKQNMGFAPKLRPQDVQILDALEFDGIWRPVKPNDANVISYVRNGERRYLLVNDPAMFNFFANKQAMDGVIKGMNYWLGPMAENYKRNITQSLGFALAQLPSDAVAQMVLNPDAIGWVPGGSLVHGMWNKLFNKYPQLAQEGLLLSRVEPSETELMDHLRRSSIMQFLGEGFYVGTAKDPTARTLQTWMQPSNYLLYAPLIGFKQQDIINLVTGGRFLAQFGETSGREGASAFALKMGAKDEEAAMKYWTSSGQFNEHPLSANLRGFMRPMMFFNPMVQTIRNFAQIATDPDPAVRARLMARLIQIAALSSAGAAATYAWMSEEEKERERERPIEDRLGYRNLAGFRLRFSYGPEGVVESLAHNAVMDYLLERPAELGRKEAKLVMNRVFDVGSPLAVFGPQVASVFEAGANFSYFRQKPIVSPWMAALPASEQYYMSTPEFYRKLGAWLDYSPAKIEYIMRQAIGRQADETIKLMESVTGGRPVDMTYADLPYVGRLFARDPMGFGSMSMRKVDEVEAKLRQLDARLGAKGWSTTMKNPKLDVTSLPTNEMRALYNQVQYLQMLRRGHETIQGWPNLGGLDRLKQEAKALGKAELYTEERNMQVLMTRYAQALLAGNADAIEQIEGALRLLDQIPAGSPAQQANDYLQRVR